MEKVEGRVAKWMWLLSHRRRVLVINKLIASTLWHRLKCMEPPAGLLQKVQSIMVIFMGQLALGSTECTLPAEGRGGGAGLVHLESRAAAFRLQFIQCYLTGNGHHFKGSSRFWF